MQTNSPEQPCRLTKSEIARLVALGQAALVGDSNDAEHDALHVIVEALSRCIANTTGENDA